MQKEKYFKLGFLSTVSLGAVLIFLGNNFQDLQLEKVKEAFDLLYGKQKFQKAELKPQSLEINQAENLIHHIPFESRFSLGPKQAKVTVIWFLDYECTFSLKTNEIFEKIAKTYSADVRIEVRHFPLETHSNARLAAKAALAAGKHGKYWEMHRLLFLNQKTLSLNSILKLASQLGLNRDLFAKDLEDLHLDQIIDEDIRLGEALGVLGTPVVFVNGRIISGAYPFNTYDTLIKMARDYAVEYQAKYQTDAESLYDEMIKMGRTTALPNQPVLQDDVVSHDSRIFVPLQKDDIVRGAGQAIFTIVAYMDFECEFSAKVRLTLEELVKKYSQELKLVFRNYPLHFHNSAQLAAQATYAAYKQNKFWEYYDILYTHQQKLQESDLLLYAKKLGLNIESFKMQMHSDAAQTFVAKQIESGLQFGVRGTPSFFIDGRFLSGAQSLATFVTMLEEDRKIVDKMRKAGVSLKQIYAKISSATVN